jgi:hypothetical protein
MRYLVGKIQRSFLECALQKHRNVYQPITLLMTNNKQYSLHTIYVKPLISLLEHADTPRYELCCDLRVSSAKFQKCFKF